MYRIKFLVAHVIIGNRVHSAGDVIDVDEDQCKRLVKVEKTAVETDDELTVFPEPADPVEPEDPPKSPDGAQGGPEKAAKTGRR